MNEALYDEFEIRSPEARESALFESFGERLSRAAACCPGPDPGNAARALHAAGYRAGHTVHNAFGYHGTVVRDLREAPPGAAQGDER